MDTVYGELLCECCGKTKSVSPCAGECRRLVCAECVSNDSDICYECATNVKHEATEIEIYDDQGSGLETDIDP
jgi:hypothetical protein